jgi:hypothetical protein
MNAVRKDGNPNSNIYKDALTHYNKEMRKVKRSSWRDYHQGIEDVPSETRFMKIMEKQVTHKAGSVNLPNGHHTETGGDAEQEVC